MKKILLIIILSCVELLAQEQESTLNKQMNTQLLQPITVTVGGDFVVTGSFTAYRSQRVDHFITILFTQAKEKITSSLNQLETIKQVYQGLDRFPLRDITLKRMSGEILKVDLLRFRLTGDFKYNPYLMNDDVIIFSTYDDERNFIDINGAVNKPVKFQFVEGDKLSDAIMFAGGLNLAYDNVKFVEISRLKEKGEKEDLLVSSISDDVILKRGDRIRVMFDENEKRVFKVLVLGEVQKPGYVYITKNSTTIKEVVEKVGGFKPDADLNRAEVLRNYSPIEILKKQKMLLEFFDDPMQNLNPEIQLKIKQMSDEYSMARTSNLTVEDSIAFKIDNKLRVLNSEQLVDFNGLQNNSDEAANFLLRDGDVILVPLKFNYVYVFGQVEKVGYIKHEKDKDYKYYIEKSGGISEEAKDLEDVAIIKGKSRKWVVENKETTSIDSGDFIYVPKTIRRPFQYYLENFGSIASIIGSIATIILLVIQSGK